MEVMDDTHEPTDIERMRREEAKNILSEMDLDNLQWAKDFLDRYDRRRALGASRKPVGEFK